MKISTTHDLIDHPGCIGSRSSLVSVHGTMINDIIDGPGCIGVGISIQCFGTIFICKYSELECRWVVLLLCNSILMKISTTHDLIDHPSCIGLKSSSVSAHGTMINDIIDRPGCIGVGIGVQGFGTSYPVQMAMDFVIIVQYSSDDIYHS